MTSEHASAGSLLRETLDISRKSLGAMAVYIAATTVISQVSNWMVANFSNLFDSINALLSIAAISTGIFVTGLALVLQYFLLVRVLQTRSAILPGDHRVIAFIGMSLLHMLGIFAGLLLFVIPCLIVLVRWSAASGFLIGERMGIAESLGASWDATRGKSWSIFGAALTIFIPFAVLQFSHGWSIGFTGTDPTFISNIFRDFASNIVATIFSVLGVAVYHLTSNAGHWEAEIFE